MIHQNFTGKILVCFIHSIQNSPDFIFLRIRGMLVRTNRCTSWGLSMSSLSPSRLSSMVSSSLLPLKQLSSLDANSATDTFCSTLSCFDTFCLLSSRPACTTPSAPWLSVVLRKHRSKLRAAGRVWRKSQNPTDLNFYWSLFSDLSANVSTAKKAYYHDKIVLWQPSHLVVVEERPPTWL